MSRASHLVALAGQPNCGKSTLFNLLTGARQHVANYPGVTVEKRSGRARAGGFDVELVDLPGIYGLTSYSPEERVARDFLLHDRPRAVLAVLDAANLRRGLYLALQLVEMGLPLVADLNMTDVAERRGTPVDAKALERELGVPVVCTVGARGTGVDAVKAALGLVIETRNEQRDARFHLRYGDLEPAIAQLEEMLEQDVRLRVVYPARWLAVKLLEGDESAAELLDRLHAAPAHVRDAAQALRAEFRAATGQDPARHVAFVRNREAAELAQRVLRQGPAAQAPDQQAAADRNTTPGQKHISGAKPATKAPAATLTERMDRVALHRVFGPVLLVAVLLALYQVAIGVGDSTGEELRGLLVVAEDWVGLLLPAQGYLEDPLLRSLGIWTVQGITAILGYLPVFLLLFSFIAVLEDSGYMPRMAFLLDRLFRRFGLHGQSTLPLILGGVYLGGCAIPAIMSTRGIPDERARLTTILIAPMMNCLAKVPLHLILVGAYFAENQGLALFFISTVTLFMALPVAKALSLSVTSNQQRAPFLMELPPYHLPTLRAVAGRAVERSLLFVKKILSVVLAVSVVVFALITFPGVDAARKSHFQAAGDAAMDAFLAQARSLPGLAALDRAEALELLAFASQWRGERRDAQTPQDEQRVDAHFAAQNPQWLALAAGGTAQTAAPAQALRDLAATRRVLRAQLREEVFAGSFLGMAGRALEPVTRAAGFDWRINIALLSAFAAKENAAMSLGAIYGLEAEEAEEEAGEDADALASEGAASLAATPETAAGVIPDAAAGAATMASPEAAAGVLPGAVTGSTPDAAAGALPGALPKALPGAMATGADKAAGELPGTPAQSAAEASAGAGAGGIAAGIQASGSGFGPLHALSLMLFMALYPPCLPAAMTVRLASGSTRWMLFSIAYQTLLGLAVASLVFTGASWLGLTGWQAMWSFYGLCVAATIGMGLLPEDGWRRAPRTDPAAATLAGALPRQ